MNTGIRNSLIASLLLLAGALLPTTAQADFVSDINNSTAVNPVGARVLYEMNIGSFTQQGTFNAARERLAELREDGIDMIWLMPIYPRGGSNSPYAATSFTATNPKYGTIADLKVFVARAHELGMKVWLDWVCNHMAVEAEWVTTHPEYFVSSGGQMVHPNNYQDVYQLNYSNPDCVNALNDCLKFWIDECDVDGYRCDYVSSPRISPSYWSTTIPLIKSYKDKEIMFLGEAEFAQDQTRLNNVGFDYDFAWWYQSRLKEFGANGVLATTLKNQTNTFINASRAQKYGRMMFLTNHDQNYNDGGFTMEKFYGSNRYAMTVLLYTIYGMPLVYNGQEIGGSQVLNYFTDTKINWAAVDVKMRNTMRTLAALKHTVPALRDATQGSDTPEPTWVTVTGANQNNIMAYTRKSRDSEVLVVLNFAATEAVANLSGLTAGTWSCWLNSSTIKGGTSRKNETFGASQSITIEPKGYRVYVKGSFREEDNVQEDKPISDLVDDAAYSVFYETPSEAVICVWLWNDQKGQFTANSWPGDQLTRIGLASNGSVIYKYVINVAEGENPPTNLIFTKNGSDDAAKTFDGAFLNHGYYIEGQGMATYQVPTSGVTAIKVDADDADAPVYNLMGQMMPAGQTLRPGIYVKKGQKFIVR